MVFASLLIQVIILCVTFGWLSEYTVAVYSGFTILGAAVVIYIMNEDINSKL